MRESTILVTADYNCFFIQGDEDLQEGPPLTAGRFEYGEEWLIDAPYGDLMLVSVLDGLVEESADMLTPYGPGTYRLRVAATGRTEYWDGLAPVDRQPVVRMLIQTWQTAASPRVLHQHRNRITGEIERHT